ncbi:MAG: S9 family peptidase, partial [Tunicatimonas sp.]
EFAQLFWYDSETGRTRMLSDGESRNSNGTWSNQGDRFVFSSTRRSGKDFDIYVSSMQSPQEAELLVDRGQGIWYPTDWSPDDQKIILGQYQSAAKANLYVLDVAEKSLTPINDTSATAYFGGGQWNADGSGLFVISNQAGEFRTLMYYDIGTKELTPLTNDIPWDVENIAINADRSQLAFVTNEDGINQLYVLDTEQRTYQKVDGLPMGQIYSMVFHPKDNQLALSIGTAQSPGDAYVLDLSDGNRLTRWTNSEVGGLNTETFVQPELISFPSYDSTIQKERQIPAFYFRPTETNGPTPVVLYIHGGPEGQYTPYFSSFVNYLVNEMGIAVVAPNVRGSAGYGKSYLQLDNGFQRKESVKDIGALLDWVEKQPELDNERVAVYGGSYGGYMVLASMVDYNDRLRCGVDVVGISNFVTFLENTEEYRRDLRRAEYGDERDPEMRAFLKKISPNNQAEKIKKPLFVIQGANDPRVPASESEQMVEEIRGTGSEVWYLLAKDEGHGFRKKGNRDYQYNAVALFFQQYLLGD